MPSQTRKNRKSSKGTRKNKMPKAATSVTTVAKVVKAVMNRQLEHKQKSWVIETDVSHYPDISGNQILPLVGPLTQGTDGNQRVGMRVKPLSIVVKGHVGYDPAVGGCESIRPVLYFLNSRQLKTNAGITANHVGISAQLLEDCDGSNLRFDGSLSVAQYPVNTDDYSIIRVLRLSITKDNTTSSDGKSYFDYSVKLNAPAHLIFDEGSNYPTNYAPFLAIGWYKTDGGAPEAVDWLSHTAKTFMSYIDA